jgi:hypothetical protein
MNFRDFVTPVTPAKKLVLRLEGLILLGVTPVTLVTPEKQSFIILM